MEMKKHREHTTHQRGIFFGEPHWVHYTVYHDMTDTLSQECNLRRVMDGNIRWTLPRGTLERAFTVNYTGTMASSRSKN